MDWKPGQRIQTLPRWLWPFAVLCRNLIRLGGQESWLGAPLEKNRESRREGLRKLSFGVEYVCESGVEGDIAEFGTMSGASASEMARALMMFGNEANGPKRLHLFDSFEGLPEAQAEADRQAPAVRSGLWAKGACHGLGQDELVGLCLKFLPRERVIAHKGWFSQTLPRVAEGTKFAMIHVDCDLYQSTADVLGPCFSRGLLSEGAAVFFDDWNCNRASPLFGERKAWAEATEKFGVVYSDCGEYGRDGRKFIVHSYRTSR